MGLCVVFGLEFGLFVIAGFGNYGELMIMDDFVVGVANVVR